MAQLTKETAFLLAIDQFEELFTFADLVERKHLRSPAPNRPSASRHRPLFVISTVRSDFLYQYDELLPRLVPVRNRLGKLWTLPLIRAEALRDRARCAGYRVPELIEPIEAMSKCR